MLTTKFLLGDSTVHVMKMNDDTALDNLPARIYTLTYNEFQGFYLSITNDQLHIPAKIYGNTKTRVDKCIKSYLERPMSTGILMTGHKGTGKTLLMSMLANKMVKDLGIPVILIRSAYGGEQFMSFIELLGECCLVFDEFAKMYNKDSDAPQESLLSLMDGVDKTKRMIIMTENSEFDINEFMFNRPSRIYYHFKYNKMDEDSIKDYCTDFGVEEDITKEIFELARKTRIFSFDMLQSIVEEYLRFKQPISEIITDLNIDIDERDEEVIEVIKIMNKTTQKEFQLASFQTNIIQKPLSYDYAVIAIIDNHEDYDVISPNQPPSHTKASGTVEDFSNKRKNKKMKKLEEKTRSITFSESDLVYETSGNLIYQCDNDDNIIVIAKDMPRINYKFNRFLF